MAASWAASVEELQEKKKWMKTENDIDENSL